MIKEKPQRMIHKEVTGLVAAPGDALAVLRRADPSDRAEAYHHLGLRLNYSPATETVRAEISLSAHRGALVCVRRST